ncbi:MAG: ADP-ribosylglycohydrolase family protein [Phycisphaerae bacterium]
MATLKEKFRGCIAGSWVGSSMGAPVEGWSPEQIEQTHGVLREPVAYEHYSNGWQRPAGTTEDGIERQKLIATAIIEKQERILASDLVGVWRRDLDPEKVPYKQERFDLSLLELAAAGVPAFELGRFWHHQNVNSVARASHPLGLINAGDPRAAADDTYEVGRVYAKESSTALRWAALYNASIAAACRPDATVDDVLRTARQYAGYRSEPGGLYARYDTISDELGRALEWSRECTDWRALRDRFAEHYYGGPHVTYGMSQANEVVCKGVAIFAVAGGDPEETIVAAVNFGRDTDCIAAVAGGLAGALAGIARVPGKWVETVNDATRRDPYTNNNRTIEETADALLEAYRLRRRRLAEWLNLMDDGEPHL